MGIQEVDPQRLNDSNHLGAELRSTSAPSKARSHITSSPHEVQHASTSTSATLKAARTGYLGPQRDQIYCTNNVILDETFFPARLQDQRKMGHYNLAPRTRHMTLIHGSMEAAAVVYKCILTLLVRVYPSGWLYKPGLRPGLALPWSETRVPP